MPFPQTPLPVFVDIAPGASPTGTLDSWDPFWTDITSDVRVAQGIVIEEGIPDEANQADPGTCGLTLDNRSGNYSPRNPLGLYWGELVRNTPLRIRLQRGVDTFTRTVAAGSWGTSETGIAWSGVGSAFSVNGSQGLIALPAANSTAVTTAVGAGAWDFDLAVTISVNVIPTGGDWINNINFRRSGNANTYSLQIDFTPAGALNLFLSRTIASAATTLSSAGAGLTPVANTGYKVRVKADGAFVGAKLWLAAGSEPAAWTVQSSAEGGFTLDNTALGTNIQFQSSRLTGNVATTVGTWDDLTIVTYLFIGTVPEWPVRWDKTGNDSTVPLKATGVLRRLQQGTNPLKSPLYAYLDQFTPAALYTLEDESGAATAASQTPGVAPAYIFSTNPSGWNDPPALGGTSGQYTVAVDTTISGVLPRMTPSGGWSYLFAFYMPVLPAVDALMFRVQGSGTVTSWDVRASSSFGGIIFIVGTTSDGTVVVNVSITFVPGRWNIAQVEIQQVTTTVTGRIVCYDLQTGGVTGSTSAPVTGTIGSPNSWALYGSTGFQDGAAGPVVFYPRMSPVSTANLVAAGRGFAGETADVRLARVFAEQGVRLDLLAGTASRLGAQTADTLLGVAAEATDTDLGLLTEFHGGLRYRPRGRRYNQNARLVLDFAQGHIAEAPEPTDDDQRLRNDVTVTRKDGSSARAFDAGSIALHGKYDTSGQINPYADADLLSQAAFRLYLGTWDDLRWPLIELNLAGNPSLIERAISVDPGALVTVSNPPANLPVGTLQLLVEAVKHTLKPFRWDTELTCSSYQPWRIMDTITANVRNRIDVVGSTLTAGVNSSALTLSVTNAGTIWSSAAVPFDINLNGETMTVTAITGTSSQTFTVTRGVNGIAKAHLAGEPIHLDAIMYVAL